MNLRTHAESFSRHAAVSQSRPLDVSLASMPFGQLSMPSIALAILKSTLAARGLQARATHFTLDFAERIGVQLYSMIAVGFPGNQALAADWVFSHLLPGDHADNPDEYLRQIIDNEDPDSLIGPVDPVSFIKGFREGLLYAREHSRAFVLTCAEQLVADGAPIIGFTSTFQQNAASIAVAQEIKRLAPKTMIVMGGANCEGEMGAQLIRTYDCLDAVISGEADWIFPQFVQCVKRGESPAGIAGVHLRDVPSPPAIQASFVLDMDSLPDCDFDDYFRQLAESNLVDKVEPMVLYETARGCWWGEKAHCTFCGLNGQTMQYRRKSPARALNELASLTTRYPGRAICVVDNILDMSYFKTFIPALKEASLNADLFWEVKSNLKKSHVRQLKEANIRRIQPGVESFSSQVLTLMKKGVSGHSEYPASQMVPGDRNRADLEYSLGLPGRGPGGVPEDGGLPADAFPSYAADHRKADPPRSVQPELHGLRRAGLQPCSPVSRLQICVPAKRRNHAQSRLLFRLRLCRRPRH